MTKMHALTKSPAINYESLGTRVLVVSNVKDYLVFTAVGLDAVVCMLGYTSQTNVTIDLLQLREDQSR